MKKSEIDKLMKIDEEYEKKHAKWYWEIIDWLKENIWWPIERIWEWPGDRLNDIKWFIQRGRRGYAECDTWSLDGYLSGWLPQALKKLRNRKIGYPAGLNEKKWKKILEEIIKGFEIDKKITDFEFKQKDWKKLEKIRKRGLELFVKYYNNLWD